MSESIKHECGMALVRLLKPIEFYHEKYGTAFYGLNKLHLLMQKQRNRGQDGVGIATVKLHPTPGERFISRKRSNSQQPIKDVFEQVFWHFKDLSKEQINDPTFLRENFPYMGEVLMGHLRYGTHGANTIEQVHPFLRPNNWMSRNLLLAGNFNMTNVDELFNFLVEDLGQHPKEKSDTVTVLEKIGHFLDDEVQHWFDYFKKEDDYTNKEITNRIAKNLNLQRILKRATKGLDGGYALIGALGHGDAFALRDPNGIRPAFYYQDDEVVVVASERPAIQSAFNVNYQLIQELKPAHALIIKKDGQVSELPFTAERERLACSFERIYFSRGTDRDIYLERKKLGEQLALPVMKAVDFDFENTVFSFIPNTAETAFFGFMEGINDIYNNIKTRKIADLQAKGEFSVEKVAEILKGMPRVEKLAVKDDKARTFITNDSSRDEMVSHVYDVTYGIVRNNIDTLVLMDDSIVRGTTLKNSIIKIMARLHPKRIIIVSSAPQIRYPDCYGIDMSKMGEFVAFQAVVKLLKARGLDNKLDDVYELAKAQEKLPKERQRNVVQELYDLFDYEDISDMIAEIVTPDDGITPSVSVIYQTLDGVKTACPNNRGDWYFSGDYPTPGGNRVVNRAFVNYMENKNVRAY